MILKKYNVFYEGIDTHNANEKQEISQQDLENKNKLKAIKDIPPEGDPGKNSPKEKIKTLSEEVKKYKEKINQMEDGEEKTDLTKSLRVVETFLNKNKNLGNKKLIEMLDSKQPQSEEWKKFREALSNLSDKFDKKEKKELAKEEIEKLKTMSNSEFLKYPPEERLKFITKEHLKPQDVKEGTKITFTFTFDGQYNKELWLKTTAGQVLPTTVNVVKQGDTEYTRRGLKGEFFTKAGKRLIINEGTHIEIGKPLTKEQIEKIENINEMKYKAYMGELKAEAIQDEKLKKEFFTEDGKLLEKYKLDDKQKELFKQNPDIVKESIARNIDPKFAVICFADAVKGKSMMDSGRSVTLEDMFTEFDRIKGRQAIVQKDINDGVKVLMLREFGGNNWKEKAQSLGIKADVIKNYEHKEGTYNKEYHKGAPLPPEVQANLEKIYSGGNSKDKLVLETIDKLNDYKNFKQNIAEFLIDYYKTFDKPLYMANGRLGGVRSLDEQRNIISHGNGATKVKDPSHSYHTKGLAIDLAVNPHNHKAYVLAAQHGLWSGKEMWGWDYVHFQVEYSGSRRKKQARLSYMASNGTLPTNYT